jgi:hypothetical protein
MPVVVRLSPSPKPQKKWRVTFEDGSGSHVDFGQLGYSDYTIHGDAARMKRYLVRHRQTRTGENWSDPKTAGFWSRWLLWSEPTLAGARRLIERKFHIKVR